VAPPERPPLTDAELDALQWVADPAADLAVAEILGPFHATADAEARDRIARVEALNEVIRSWKDNDEVARWPGDATIAPELREPLDRFLAEARKLPDWADRQRMKNAESLFMDQGALSVTILFCASLPECYVVPDLAAVLQATGQLVDRADHRIRTTGAMIFPVMMVGGLTAGDGGGIAQVLKVRLIHAMVRNLILRGSPEAAAFKLQAANDSSEDQIPPLAAIQPHDKMFRALHVHGWNLRACALPNNQEELAYTLLTFSYVYLRSMRRLGIALTPSQEEDYLHLWNVAGHVLGIRRELMADKMEEAATLFTRMQARGRADVGNRTGEKDQRPALGQALMGAMQAVFPAGVLKAFPVLLTRRFLEPESVRDLGLDGRVSWLSRTLFKMVMGLARGIDAFMRLFFKDFSISRLLTRAIGYRLTCAMLMSQTRELSVPSTLRPGIKALIASWGVDSKASTRMNALEDKLTTGGHWHPLDWPHQP